MNLEFNVVLAGKQASWTDNKTDAHADEGANFTMKVIKLSAYSFDSSQIQIVW
jgi:hypothetical protein